MVIDRASIAYRVELGIFLAITIEAIMTAIRASPRARPARIPRRTQGLRHGRIEIILVPVCVPVHLGVVPDNGGLGRHSIIERGGEIQTPGMSRRMRKSMLSNGRPRVYRIDPTMIHEASTPYPKKQNKGLTE